MAWLGGIGALARGLRVIAPDRPDEPGLFADPRLGLARGAREPQVWLAGLLDRLGDARRSRVGTSPGGWLALGSAVGAPKW